MTNIELYIDTHLCDIPNPESLGIRLNKVLINPSELNTKDAQYSYTITIPSTPINNEVLRYANVEEVNDKFNHDYQAQLYVNSIKIFDGRFRLNEIDAEGNFKGNLVIPAKKTVKDLFGDTKMHEIKTEWPIDFSDMVSSLNYWNKQEGIQSCMFPYVLYGLLPKVPDAEGNYTGKTVWDESVRLGIEDFPPSINCMQAIERLFSSLKDESGNARKIGGTAFNDPRLLNLYMSYSNPTDYKQEWNWGDLGKMRIAGKWSNYKPTQGESNQQIQNYEKNLYINYDDRTAYTVNLLNSTMTEIDTTKSFDKGYNIKEVESLDRAGKKYLSHRIVIPVSGLYKVSFKANISVNTEENESRWNRDAKVKFVSGKYKHRKTSNLFNNKSYEIKILRDFGSGDFALDSEGIDLNYFRNNYPQNYPWTDQTKNVYYFPSASRKSVFMVDPSVNQRLIGGFHWGKKTDSERNPHGDDFAHIMSIKPGWSWDVTFSQSEKIFSAIKSGGYDVWGYPPKIENGVYDDDLVDDLSSEDEEETSISDLKLDWYESNKYKIDLEGVTNSIERSGDSKGNGEFYQVIWLNAGEAVTVAAVSDEGTANTSGNRTYGWTIHEIDFDLTIEPFRTDVEWIKIDSDGVGTAPMKWDDKSNFRSGNIDLIKFLPSDQKVDEWLDNFCKAFNLQLTENDKGKFELNVKQSSQMYSTASLIDLDSKTTIAKRTNESLGLPAVFELGFKVNEEEQGFVNAKENSLENLDGGGKIETGSIDGSTVAQTTSFSYNWFTPIYLKKDKDLNLLLPMISNREVWNQDSSYKEMIGKIYTNYAQRFWYRSKDLYNLGAIWENRDLLEDNDRLQDFYIPQLTDTLSGESRMVLHYKNEPYSILRNYFSVIVTNNSNYTQVECYLTPDEYQRINGLNLAKLNGDLYYIANLEGYDPMGRDKTKLKLIRKL